MSFSRMGTKGEVIEMVVINGIEIQKRREALKIAFADEGVYEKIQVSFQEVDTPHGSFFMFAVANEGYSERKMLFVSAIQRILPKIQDYLVAETGCDMSQILVDHQSKLIHS
jgi:hypothetical protein